MFNFFRKKPVIQKTKSDILFSLQKEIDSYPKNSWFRYRQARASYLSDFLNREIPAYNFSQPSQKESMIKNIMLEIYLHYLSIRNEGSSSKLGESLKKSLIEILNLNKNASHYAIEGAVKDFTKIDPKPLLFHASQLSLEEEKKSSSRGLFDAKGKSHNQIIFLCRNANKAIDVMVNPPKRASYFR